jgi:hypothetical protein
LTAPANKLLLSLTVCILLAGCNTVSDVSPMEGGDLDWARPIADGVATDIYGEGLVMFRVVATYLDYSGFLYDIVQHPFWTFEYFHIESDTLIRIVVHPDGSTTVSEAGSLYEDEIDFTFTSVDVQDWLSLARHCYRYVTGREDDVCFGLAARCQESDSTGIVTLYDGNFEKLAYVSIDLVNGTINHINLI